MVSDTFNVPLDVNQISYESHKRDSSGAVLQSPDSRFVLKSRERFLCLSNGNVFLHKDSAYASF